VTVNGAAAEELAHRFAAMEERMMRLAVVRRRDMAMETERVGENGRDVSMR
jgi:hypothetical protein